MTSNINFNIERKNIFCGKEHRFADNFAASVKANIMMPAKIMILT